MKTLNKYIFTALMVTGLSACSFLEEDPQSFVSGKNYFKNAQQCESVVNSTYTQLRAVFNETFWLMTEGTSDIIYNPSSSNINAIMDISPARCGVSESIWNNSYKMVMYANAAVEGIKTAPVDSLVRARLISEAKVMRAFVDSNAKFPHENN